MRNNYKVKLFTALILVYIIWGSTYLGVKYALNDLPPLFLTSIRFLIAGSLLFIFTLINGQKLPNKEQIFGSSYLGILLSGIGTGGIAYAIVYIPSGLVALLVAMLPIWTFLLDFLFFSKIKPSILSLLGLFLGAIGVLFLFNPFESVKGVSLPIVPTLVIFVSCITWAYGSLISVKTKQASGSQTTAIQMFAGGIFALLLSYFTENHQFEALQSISLWTVVSMVYLIFIGSHVGFSAYVWLINNAPPILTSTYAYVNPVVALILGYFFAGETMNDVSLIASVIILLGVVLMTIGRRKMKAELE